jgi:hypothetical protein
VTPLATVLLVGVLLGTSAGQLLFKAVSVRGMRAGAGNYWTTLFASPLLWIGFAIYGAELVLYMAFLSIVPLWQGVMVASFDLLLVLIAHSDEVGRGFRAKSATHSN